MESLPDDCLLRIAKALDDAKKVGNVLVLLTQLLPGASRRLCTAARAVLARLPHLDVCEGSVVRGLDVSGAAVTAVLMRSDELTSLNLSQCVKITDEVVTTATNCTQLTSLNLSHCLSLIHI